MLKKLFKDERGEDIIEYALLVSFIALVALAGIEVLGPTLKQIFLDIEAALNPPGP